MVYIYIGKPIDEFFRVRMLRPGVKKGKNEWNINSMGWGGRGMEGIDHFSVLKLLGLCPVLYLGKVSDGMSWDVKEMSINLLTSH